MGAERFLCRYNINKDNLFSCNGSWKQRTQDKEKKYNIKIYVHRKRERPSSVCLANLSSPTSLAYPVKELLLYQGHNLLDIGPQSTVTVSNSVTEDGLREVACHCNTNKATHFLSWVIKTKDPQQQQKENKHVGLCA